MTVAVLIPLLGRPHRVAPVVASAAGATPGARIVLLCSPGDTEVIREAERFAETVVVPWLHGPGDYARKINHGASITDDPWIFTGADDLDFHDGWLDAALEHDGPGIGVIGTNDLGNSRVMAGEHATHSLVARWYYELGTIDQPRAIYHEGYPHEYVDDELVATAVKRDAWAFAAGSKVEHLHPSWGKAPMDDLYADQRRRMREGRKVYGKRQRLWT